MTYIRQDDYDADRQRPKLLTPYLNAMVTYLKARHPNASGQVIEDFVKDVIRKRMKSPMVEALVHKREGHSEPVKMPFDKYVMTVIKDNNLSPSGTCYHPVSRKPSFLRMSIEGKVKARNDFKKKYLDYEAQGMKRESQYYNLNQANAKIFNNAIAGGMKTVQFILSCKAGFNAITSAGRMSVKQGYSFIERAVNANLYLPSMRDATTYVLNHAQNIPVEFIPLIDNGVLYIPTVDEVVSYLINSVERYTTRIDPVELVELLTNLSVAQRAYVFYAGCLNNLCRFNETMMRQWIDSCFIKLPLDASVYQDIDIAEVKSFKGDVVACVLSTHYTVLGLHPHKTNVWNSLKDAAKYNPDGVKAFIYCCRHFVAHFEPMVHVLRPIFQIKTTFSKLVFQHRMARLSVPLSDTDSNIFSTQELVRWKRGVIDFEQESYEMNALVTFILSQSLEHVFARLSSGFGVEKNDVYKISMKNEFLYPLLLQTSLGKHYLAIAEMQEGSLLPNPRKDFKGVNLRSSTYPKIIRDGFDKFVVDLFAKIKKGKPIRAGSVLKHVSDLEQTIYQSIQDRSSEYLQTVTIKRQEDYKNSDISQYFYYELWKAVFAPDYGEMVIPNKCYKIPLKGNKKLFKNKEFMDKMTIEHPALAARLKTFMEQNPKRDISAVLIPPFKGKIQPFFLEIMNIRSHISQVLTGYYLVLNAMGIGTVEQKNDGLVSDFFCVDTALLD